ncbi:LSU m3Psi1915 methyltransferase RlmH [Mucinivorans hirudinis]|uniref:Ribosomal RNA large subunit methyltransferase H n=1 Tax=Mucinivorans hirudinis TaxID=1433126 RepID=A0A060REF9_9BACT|nr:LSU m3Psi1915 methyltransferase RlmH [Mucinivorans hirudinis]
MVIELIVVGKTTARYLEEGIDEYLARLKHYTKFTYTVIPELKNAKSLRENQIKEAEGELILAKIATSDRLVLLDDKGMKPTSEKMAEWLQEAMNRATRKMVFAVGGAYGFSERVYDRADEKLSLSPLTFSHQMVRLIFLEQVYRSFTILSNEPYHHR